MCGPGGSGYILIAGTIKYKEEQCGVCAYNIKYDRAVCVDTIKYVCVVCVCGVKDECVVMSSMHGGACQCLVM